MGPAFSVVGWRETDRATICPHSCLCDQMGYHCAFSAGLGACLWCLYFVHESQQGGRDVSMSPQNSIGRQRSHGDS